MTKVQLEKYQVLIYIIAILVGLLFGTSFPELTQLFETLLWPTLGLLLYATFTQTSLSRLRPAFRDKKFLSTALFGNFILIPLIVWGVNFLTAGEYCHSVGCSFGLIGALYRLVYHFHTTRWW